MADRDPRSRSRSRSRSRERDSASYGARLHARRDAEARYSGDSSHASDRPASSNSASWDGSRRPESPRRRLDGIASIARDIAASSAGSAAAAGGAGAAVAVAIAAPPRSVPTAARRVVAINVHFAYGLGNLLFMHHAAYAAAKAMGGADIWFRADYGEQPDRPNVRVFSRLFSHLRLVTYGDIGALPRPTAWHKEPPRQHFFAPIAIPASGNLVLQGFFQSHKYFPGLRTEIRDLLWRNEAEAIAELRAKHAALHGTATTICVHVRRGDYLEKPGFLPPASEAYYRGALKAVLDFAPGSRLVVFSDDVAFVKSWALIAQPAVESGSADAAPAAASGAAAPALSVTVAPVAAACPEGETAAASSGGASSSSAAALPASDSASSGSAGAVGGAGALPAPPASAASARASSSSSSAAAAASPATSSVLAGRPGVTVHIEEEPDNFKALVLMSLCSHFVIANSSMSLNAFLLRSNEGARLYAPRAWFGQYGHAFKIEDIVPPGTRVL